MIKSAVMKSGIIPLAWVADMKSLIRDTGRVVDFDYMATLNGVNAYRRGGFKVKMAEAVAIGETAVDVDPLQYPLIAGARISFRKYAAVTVNVGAAGAAGGAVSVPVDALTGPIPAGQVLHFGTNKFAVLSADAAAGAVTISTLAIPTALVDADVAVWQGGDKELIVAADAEAEATTITVEPPKFAVADNEEGWAIAPLYERMNANSIIIPESTIMIEVDPDTNRKIIPLALHPLGVAATGQPMVILTNAKNDSRTDAISGYGVTYGGSLFENIMWDSINNGGTLPAGFKTLLGSRYIWLKSRDARGE